MPEKDGHTDTNGTSNMSAADSANGTNGTNPNAARTTATPANNTRKRTPDEYTKNFDLNEISPLRTSTASTASSTHSNDSQTTTRNGNAAHLSSPPIVLNMTGPPGSGKHQDSPPEIDDETFMPGSKRSNKFRGTYEDILAKLDLSEKARLPFVCAIVLCILLTIVLIVMAVFWPRIPAYMRSPVCVDRECLDASAQVSV